MKWLEIIELRSVGKYRAEVEAGLSRLTAGTDEESALRDIKVYRNVSIDTDWSIHLHFQSPQKEMSTSPLALRLAAALKKFGLVYHSVWQDKGGIL
jgi:hypothetical protein